MRREAKEVQLKAEISKFSKLKIMTPEQIIIWDYLVVNAQGMINAKHIGDIAVAIDEPPY